MDKIHKPQLYNFYIRYGIALIFVFGFTFGALYHVKNQTDTSRIFFEPSTNVMICDPSIKTAHVENIKMFYTQADHTLSLRSMICTFDTIFDGSDDDRAYLFGFVTYELDSRRVSRPDIVQYFYKRIVESNSDDALSIYIKNEKIKE